MKKLIVILIMILSSLSYSQELIVLLDSDYKNKETRELLASLTTPISSSYAKTLDRFISMVKDSLAIANLSDAFDVMYLLANETSEAGLKNLVKRQHDATAVNSPTFTQWEGFTGNGTSSYLNTNWNGRTAGHAVAYTLNSGSFGIYFRTNTDKVNFEVHGAWSTSDNGGSAKRIQINRPNGYESNYGVAINSAGWTLSSTNKINGMYIGSRTASNVLKLFVNSNEIISATTAVSDIPNQNVLLLAVNTTGGAGFFENDQISFAFLGAGLTASEVSKLTNCIEWYMDSLNRGVIP